MTRLTVRKEMISNDTNALGTFTTYCMTDESAIKGAINKLGRIEDLLDKYDIEEVCELDKHLRHEKEVLNQLHTQPKEIVDKIKKKLSEANFDIVSKKDGYSYTNNFLEQILKEYEEK